MSARMFISHISEEASVAAQLKVTLTNDFLGLLEVFVSSDTESIAAGEEWLTSINRVLRESSVFLVLAAPPPFSVRGSTSKLGPRGCETSLSSLCAMRD